MPKDHGPPADRIAGPARGLAAGPCGGLVAGRSPAGGAGPAAGGGAGVTGIGGGTGGLVGAGVGGQQGGRRGAGEESEVDPGAQDVQGAGGSGGFELLGQGGEVVICSQDRGRGQISAGQGSSAG